MGESLAMAREPGLLNLSEDDCRVVAESTADCAAWTLPLIEARALDDTRSREAIEGLRAFARGEVHIGVAPLGVVRAGRQWCLPRRSRGDLGSESKSKGMRVASCQGAGESASSSRIGSVWVLSLKLIFVPGCRRHPA